MKKFAIYLGSVFIFSCLAMSFVSCDNNDDDSEPDVYGCTDPSSANYNPDATIDDGSCVPKPQGSVKALVLLYTATGCQYCGSQGYPTFKELKANNGKYIVPMSVHTSMGGDPMYVEKYVSGFMKTYGTSGIPAFFIVNKKTSDQAYLNQVIANYPLLADVNFKTEISGDIINISSAVQFYDNPSGEDNYSADFYLSAYLLESNIDGSKGAGSYEQVGISGLDWENDYTHDNVLRTTSNPNTVFGELIASSPVPDDTLIYKNLQLNINSSWNKDNLDVAVIVWTKQIGTNYFAFINAADNRTP